MMTSAARSIPPRFTLDRDQVSQVNLSTPGPDVQLLAADASDRRFYRVHLLDHSVICMQFPSWKGGYGGDPLSWLGMQEALLAIGMPVPEVYLVDRDRAQIWTEDLGDAFLHSSLNGQSLDRTNPESANTLRLYEDSIDLLLQAQYPEIEPPAHPALGLAFDTDKLMFEMNFFVTHFVEGLLNRHNWTSTAEGQGVKKDMKELCVWLSNRQRVLCHRDYHVRNIMIHENKACWIDFQDARMGPHTYDVVSLIRDSYVHITEPTRTALYARYMSGLTAARARRNLAPILDLEVELLCMGLQRNVKAMGSFAYLAREKGKPNYLQYVIPTLDTLTNPTGRACAGFTLNSRFPTFMAFLDDLRGGALHADLQRVLNIAATEPKSQV